MAVSSPPSSCGDTLLHPRLQSLQNQQQRVSRAGLVYGSSFSRGSCLDGSARNRVLQKPDDMWYDAERFQLVSYFCHFKLINFNIECTYRIQVRSYCISFVFIFCWLKKVIIVYYTVRYYFLYTHSKLVLERNFALESQ